MARDMLEEAPLAPVDEKAALRDRWIAALRQQGHRQCVGSYFAVKNDGKAHACALGLLGEVAGLRMIDVLFMSPEYIASHAGLNKRQTSKVILMNDGHGYPKHTFGQIADRVEEWFR